MQSLCLLLTFMENLPDFSDILSKELESSSSMNLSALLCKFSILVRDLELGNMRKKVQQLKFDRAKLLTRILLSCKPKNLFNLISNLVCLQPMFKNDL